MNVFVPSVGTSPGLLSMPALDAPSADVISRLWTPAFPSADMVGAAAALFDRHPIPERDYVSHSVRMARELGFRDPRDRAERNVHRETVEGPRWLVEVSPAVVGVKRTDPVRAERTRERLRARQEASAVRGAGLVRRAAGPPRRVVGPDGIPRLVYPVPVGGWGMGQRFSAWEVEAIFSDVAPGRGVVRVWSRKSRARMVERLGQLDWAPLFESGDPPAMITLTYPGDWQTVAPDSAACRAHVERLRKRFRRCWGRTLIGVWKREFQERGAPHYHILMVPPRGRNAAGENFKAWLSREWAAVVGHPDPVERANHQLAGTGIDYADGMRSSDPKRVGVYFAKHGSFSDKEYQNVAPDLWTGSVGRFWGVWGLSVAIAAVEVAPVEGQAAARTLRRYSRANSYVARVPVWRYRTVIDPDTGEVRAKWRKSSKLTRVYRVRRDTGFLVVNDGPALASQLARHLDRLRRPEQVMKPSGAGPLGFLP